MIFSLFRKKSVTLTEEEVIEEEVADGPWVKPPITPPDLPKYEKPKPEITAEFYKVLDSIQRGSDFVFVSGVAGTGKSTLIELIKDKLKKKIIVVAPTGIAALNIGGSTIHSVFRLPFGPCPIGNKIYGYGALVLENLDVLIIDEISMVRPDILDAVSETLKIVRNNNKPFGGVQVAVFGDLFQLSPVSDEESDQILRKKYLSNFFFDAECLKNIEPEVFPLTKVFRQEDPIFLAVLQSIRVGKDLENAIKFINDSCFDPKGAEETALTLTTRTQQAEELNHLKLNELRKEKRTYHASMNGDYFKNKSDKQLPAPVNLELKEGAQVLLVKNNKAHWVNGDLGTVISLEGDRIEVQLARGGNVVVPKETWGHYRYKFNEETQEIEKETVAEYKQYPLRLGWAVTIHKSQGLTLDSCTVDVGPDGAFLHGQVYVALSRCKSIEALRLKRKLSIFDIKLDETVLEFQKMFFD